MQDEIEGLRIEEDCEERRILYTLMDRIAMEEDGFKENLALLAKLDFVFAKGKLSAQMGTPGNRPSIPRASYA